ncbi:MAG: hypothetical protein L6Q46_04990 [Flavobacterium sp.]|nr:hypothetical protein [Flavobacterium sp.]MCK6607646.1 hypothetical protein [Flavobacterium sp.]
MEVIVCNEILEANETAHSKVGSGITLCDKTFTDLKDIVDMEIPFIKAGI